MADDRQIEKEAAAEKSAQPVVKRPPFSSLFGAAALIWSVVCAVFMILEVSDQRAFVAANALNTARASFEKDIAFRRWAAKHGGVYVPVTDETPPNPYLTIPERDITTPSGVPLTRMNPAYMTRQVYEISRLQPGAPQGHITSLNPIRPENAPDAWERMVLEKFEKGEREFSEFQDINGKPYFRYMRSLDTEQPCLKCHATQGYREGDVRGGISVSIPMESSIHTMYRSSLLHVLMIAAIWLAGLAGLWFSYRKVSAASRALRDKMNFAENLILNSTVPTFVIDGDHKVLIWNRALEVLSGVRAPDIIATDQHWRAFYATPQPCLADYVIDGNIGQAAALYEHFYPSRLIRDGMHAEGDFVLNNRSCRLSFASAPIRDQDGTIIAAIETLEDITERISLEAQLLQSQKMESLGILAGGVAHDFNNVLTVIGGYADLLKLTLENDQENLPLVREISASTKRASEITHGLLAFSGKHDMQLQYDDLNQILESIRKSLGRLIREDITLVIQACPEHLPVYVDRVQIEQALINLVVNARDALETGGLITVASMTAELGQPLKEGTAEIPPGRYAGFCVRDNGSGMDSETVKNIFEPFFTTKQKGKGTGLGLSIVHKIVFRHNGYISVVSTPGRGAEFRIYLPLYSGQALQRAAENAAPVNYHGSETVLVAEDDAAIMKLLGEVLQRYGYTVLTAGDGVEALELFNRQGDRIQAAIVDVIMPRMNGSELVEALRRQRPELPVIMTSGYTEEEVDRQALDQLKVLFMPKPLKPLELLAALRSTLENFNRGQGA